MNTLGLHATRAPHLLVHVRGLSCDPPCDIMLQSNATDARYVSVSVDGMKLEPGPDTWSLVPGALEQATPLQPVDVRIGVLEVL